MTDETTNPETVSMPSEAAPAAPEAPAAPAPRGRRRWYTALGVAALAVVAIAAVAILAGRGGIVPGAPKYLPATTVAYLDVRLDLPGDQRDQVAALMSRFPGFADKAAFESKLDETFDRLLGQVRDGTYSYTGDIKPWFGGQITLAVTALPKLDGNASNVPALGLIGVKDAAKARAMLDDLIAKARTAGTRVSEEAFEGATLWTFDDPRAATPDIGRAAVALTSDMILVGRSADDVRASLTLGAKGGQTLAGSTAFQDALKPLPEARLGTLYVEGSALRIALAAYVATSGMPGLDTALGAFPERIVAALRVEDGRVRLDVRTTLPASGEHPIDRASVIAGHVPAAGSLVYVEAHDLGKGIETLVTQLKSTQALAALGDQLKTVEGVLGTPLESYLDWLGDYGIVVGVDRGQPHGALVAQVNDTTVAGQRIGQLGTFIQLAAASGSAGIHVTTSEHAGATITALTLDQAPGVAIGWALKGDLFVLGVGEGAVESILDVNAATSLGADARYMEAVAAAGPAANSTVEYVDLASARTALESFIPADKRQRYDLEVKPWLEPLDRLVVVAHQDGADIVGAAILITK